MNHRSLLTALLFSLAPLGAFAETAVKVGVVGAGDAQLVAVAADGQRGLKVGDAIYANEVIKSGGGEAQLIFLDRSTLMLKQHSDIKVDRFVYDPASQDGTMTLEAAKGAFRFVGGALTKKQPVEIATPVGTIGIRGGIVDATVTPGSGATSAVFVYGRDLSFTNASGVVTSTHAFGTGFTLPTPNAVPTALSAAAVAQHFGSFRVDAGAQGLGAPEAVSTPLDLGTQANSKDADHSANDRDTGPAASSVEPNDKGDGPGRGGGNDSATPNQIAEAGPASAPVASAAVTETRNTAPAAAVTAPLAVASASADLRSTAATQLTERTTRTETPVVIPLAPILTGGSGSTGGNSGTGSGTVVTPVVSVPATTSPRSNVPTITHIGEYYTLKKSDGSIDDRGSVIGWRKDANTVRATTISALDGDTGSGELPQAAAGTNGSGTARWNGAPVTVTSYANDENTINYTRIDGASTQIQSLTGSRILATGTRWDDVRDVTRQRSNAVSGDVSFYDFLPDLQRLQTSGGSLGLFGWNVASAQALSGYGVLSPRQRDVGMAVDWKKGSFVGADLRFETVEGASGSTVAYGRVANGNGYGVQTLMSGATFDFDGDGSVGSSNPTDLHGRTGTLSVDRGGVYGRADGGIDGFAVHHTIGSGSDAVGGLTPTVLATPSANAVSAATAKTLGNTGAMLDGFAGGVIVQHDGSTSNAAAYSNNASSQVKLTLTSNNANQSTSAATGIIEVNEMGTPSNKINASFGNNGKNAYVSDRIWAAEQTTSTRFSSSSPVQSTADRGVFVAGAAASNIAPSKLCQACEFTQWGIWSGQMNNGGRTDVAAMMPVVAGQVTNFDTAGTLPATATYNGPAFLNIAEGSTYGNAVGTMQANASLGATKQINSININFDQTRMPTGKALTITNIDPGATTVANPIGLPGSGKATFGSSNLYTTYGGNQLAAGSTKINGALFGPNAQEIGGNFAVKATGVTAGGVFQGKR